MALCFPQPLHNHSTCGVDLSQAVFLAAIFEMRVCWGVCIGAAYVLLGPLCMEISQQQIWTQIFCRIGVRVEDGIPRQRHTALAHCLLGRISDAFTVAQRECQRRRGIALCPFFTSSILMRNRRPSRQRTPELHQWVCCEGP